MCWRSVAASIALLNWLKIDVRLAKVVVSSIVQICRCTSCCMQSSCWLAVACGASRSPGSEALFFAHCEEALSVDPPAQADAEEAEALPVSSCKRAHAAARGGLSVNFAHFFADSD